MNRELGRKIGLFAVIGLGVGATVGSGIFSTISEVAGVAGSGLILVVAFLIGALLQIPQALSYAELASAYPEDGGQYVYFREAGSRFLAFMCGWITFLAVDPPGLSVMAIAISNYLGVILNFHPAVLRGISILIVIFFMCLHMRSVKIGGIVQAVITVIKLIPFVLIIGIGAFCINPDLFMSTTSVENSTPGIIALLGAIAMTTYSFDGMFAACYVSGEIKNPAKNLPRGLIWSTIIVLVLYVGLAAAATGLMPMSELAQSSAPIADMASKLPQIGAFAGPAIAIVAVIVIVGALSSCLLYMPRVEYVMAKDGLFFSIFACVHKKYKTPHMAIFLFSVLVIILAMFSNLSDLLSYVTALVLLKNCASIATIFVLRKKNGYKPTYKAPGGYLMPILSVGLTFVMFMSALFSSSIFGVITCLAIIALGIPVYIFWNRKNATS
ncbi:MAG: amino acid permease [Coriobacteriia bacterium]|nr:amino acid permease [Coriobacteriia bacterium]